MRNDNSGAPSNGSISNADENNISTRNSILGSDVEAEAVLSRSPNRKRNDRARIPFFPKILF